MAEKREEKKIVDFCGLLLDASPKRKLKRRTQLLGSIGVKEFFKEGTIRVDMKTCKGVECKFCIKMCPTNALYWKHGEIGVTGELCIYCTSCVLSCMVDNCIEVLRKRPNGESERFSNPLSVLALLERTNAKNREKTVRLIFPDEESYLKRYRRSLFKFEEEK